MYKNANILFISIINSFIFKYVKQIRKLFCLNPFKYWIITNTLFLTGIELRITNVSFKEIGSISLNKKQLYGLNYIGYYLNIGCQAPPYVILFIFKSLFHFKVYRVDVVIFTTLLSYIIKYATELTTLDSETHRIEIKQRFFIRDLSEIFIERSSRWDSKWFLSF